ncbi:MAG TPA: IscS subfamily cysteine desulfurase [Bdellovibrionota bacterium]|jgi:cysteine desulfurase
MKFPIYLDCHSTTPLDSMVLEAMMPYLTSDFGNASSKSHSYGWKADCAVEKARERVAKLIGASSPKEIVFTSGATESNNFVLSGIAEKYAHLGKHIITTQIEHKCILATTERLEKKGFSVTYLPVDETGRVRAEDVEKAIRPDTILISVMAANNETGTIQPVGEIGAIARARNVLFHTDAAQAVGKIPLDVNALKIDLLSLSAHKFYGPKGMGAVYIRRKDPRVEVEPLIYGGGQENGYRSGTLNVPGIVGLGRAAEIAGEKMGAEMPRLTKLRDQLLEGLEKKLGKVHLNGHLKERLPGSLNISFPYVESDALVADLKNIAVSSTSACMSAATVPSYVLAAMGLSPDRVNSSIRIGLGRFNTEEEIVYTVDTVSQSVEKLQRSSPLYQLKEQAGARQ